jgi:integrase
VTHRIRHDAVVQELLGHSTVTITLDTYLHAGKGLQDEMAERMAALFPGPQAAAR